MLSFITQPDILPRNSIVPGYSLETPSILPGYSLETVTHRARLQPRNSIVPGYSLETPNDNLGCQSITNDSTNLNHTLRSN